MNPFILDINDAALSLWQGGERALHSPGYAALSDAKGAAGVTGKGATGRGGGGKGRVFSNVPGGGEGGAGGQAGYYFGEEARRQARLHPQRVNHRFWAQLDTRPLRPAFGASRHSADLVHAHLLDIHRQSGAEELIIAAPASLQREQLALLLGIIEQCPFRAVGLVDRAVAAAAAVGAEPWHWHIELQLHQALVTGIRFHEGAYQRERAAPVPDAGWHGFQNALCQAVADAFIRQTRFDPRHDAGSEQALCDYLPTLLAALAGEMEHDMELSGRRAQVERGLLADACAPLYERLSRAMQTDAGPLLLGETLAALPEVSTRLQGAAEFVDAAAVASAIEQHAALICVEGEGLPFITRLPAAPGRLRGLDSPKLGGKSRGNDGKAAPAPGAKAAPTPVPGGKAPAAKAAAPSRIDIIDGRLVLRPGQGAAPRINGKPATRPTPIGANDIIELPGGARWQLTELKDAAQA